MKRILLTVLAVIIFTPTIIQSAQAGTAAELSAKRHRHEKISTDPNGNAAQPCAVTSRKTGASARVGCAHVAAFQGYVDELENQHGATVYFMGGIRRGKCWSGGMHPCGKALDVCQTSRGRVAAKCHLPGRTQLAAIASRHGLYEGGRWCSSDYGHAQVGVSAADCGSQIASARRRHRVAAR